MLQDSKLPISVERDEWEEMNTLTFCMQSNMGESHLSIRSFLLGMVRHGACLELHKVLQNKK